MCPYYITFTQLNGCKINEDTKMWIILDAKLKGFTVVNLSYILVFLSKKENIIM